MGSAILGYIGAIVASVFFGSNYVPTKNYPQGDGFMFVWVFSSGVMTIGFLALFIAGKTYFVYTGLIGGTLWAMGNMCVIPIVKLIGLGLGLLLWGCTSLVTGFLAGKFGWFGLHKDQPHNSGMNWGGIICIVAAMALFFFIKPTLEDEDSKAPLMRKEQHKVPLNSIQDEYVSSTSVWDRVPANMRSFFGITLSVTSGVLYGLNMVPMKLWVQKEQDEHRLPIGLNVHQSLYFVLSHFTGIYLFSTVVFLGYCIHRRNAPEVYPQSILPSYVSGILWGIAQCGLMGATSILGYTTGFPIGSAGPLIVSSLWSVLYFREIRGSKNFAYLGGSFALIFTGIILLAESA